jgi:hypothetical protein
VFVAKRCWLFGEDMRVKVQGHDLERSGRQQFTSGMILVCGQVVLRAWIETRRENFLQTHVPSFERRLDCSRLVSLPPRE